jgi:hypothetical protein
MTSIAENLRNQNRWNNFNASDSDFTNRGRAMSKRIFRTIEFGVLTLALVLSVAWSARAQAQDRGATYPKMAPLEQYLIADRKAEIALAQSAAPPSISADATVMVLTQRGYETAAKGKNGFVCLVDRAWQAPFTDPEFWNPKVRAPICLNPQAARSVLPLQLKRTELVLAGLSKTEIMARIKTASDEKKVGLPEVGAMSYMMSRDQYLGDEFRHWHPHLMFYAPNTVEGRDWGANLSNSPVMATPDRLPDGGREPVIIFLVTVSNWSDGMADARHEKR